MLFFTGAQLKELRLADNKTAKYISSKFRSDVLTEQNIIDIENGMEFIANGYLEYNDYYMKHFNVSFSDKHFEYLYREILEDLEYFGNIKVFMFFREFETNRLPGIKFYYIEDYITDKLDDEDIKENFTEISLSHLLDLIEYQLKI